jgi:hypothetical protein
MRPLAQRGRTIPLECPLGSALIPNGQKETHVRLKWGAIDVTNLMCRIKTQNISANIQITHLKYFDFFLIKPKSVAASVELVHDQEPRLRNLIIWLQTIPLLHSYSLRFKI